ncbi:MAG: hypothetical protein QM296_05225 [Bacillota bacterium]|nr:hypothetical protein [Bacillota bacterium]
MKYVLDERQAHEMHKRHYLLSEVIYWLCASALLIEALFLRLSWQHWIVEFLLFTIMSVVKATSYVKSGIWLTWRQTARKRDCLIGAAFAASVYLLLVFLAGLVRGLAPMPPASAWPQYAIRFVIVFALTFSVLVLLRHMTLRRQKQSEADED